MNSYRFIAGVAADHPVALSCAILGVSRSGFYAWRQRDRVGTQSARARGDAALSERICAIYGESHGTYGSPRVHAELRAQHLRCARKRVERLMRQAGLVGCVRSRRRVRTTVTDPTATPAADLVERVFAPAAIGAPDRVWVADITYVATQEGWLYLAAVLDAFSRRVVGWSMADHLRTELVLDALRMALHRRRPARGLIHHSDRGCQYTAHTFSAHLQAVGLIASMSSTGDCFDNAVAESFFATLKTELLCRATWPTRAAAQSAIFRFIEAWYNTRRCHSTLGYLSPVAFEEVYQRMAVA